MNCLGRRLSKIGNRLEEGTQARGYLHLTREPRRCKEDTFVEWLKIFKKSGGRKMATPDDDDGLVGR